ncbi:nuclear transport factor 2 family protein [Nocardioides sp. B-3]|nr:nuclear transport factor 2 family protein [Nocardioides sp. B-3]UUZ60343.1 nuclear transport factor 2 family protein [Nocardioides sp. B-3]
MTDDLDLAARVRRLEDLHAIGQLRAHYCRALDDGRWDDLVDLFTPDGAFVGLSTARGHDELRTFFADLREGPLSARVALLVQRDHRPRGLTRPRRDRSDVARPALCRRRSRPHRRRSLHRSAGPQRRRPVAFPGASCDVLLLGVR